VEKTPAALLVQWGFAIAATLGVYAFVSAVKEGEARRMCSATCLLAPTYTAFERKVPNAVFRDVHSGAEVSLESYRDKVVVLNFWTKTCKPCLEEMPSVAELARIVKPMNDVAVVTVSTDETAEDASNTLRALLREEPAFASLIDPEAKQVSGRFGTTLYPETWIIDKKGVIRARFDGAREWSSSLMVELIEQIRTGGYCAVEARHGRFVGQGASTCESMVSGS